MYILGDIGNSETKIYLVNSNRKIIKSVNISTKNININILKKEIKKLTKNLKKINKILFCSVVPKTFNLIRKFFNENTKIRCYEVKDLNLRSMININVNFKQVGSDRITNAISVINNKDNFIILDFGTATTFDVVIKNSYKGGVIAPGIKLSLNTLSDKATLIPKINLKKINKIVGNNTITAVRSGFFWGYSGLIDNIIRLIKNENNKNFNTIITGGLSNLFQTSIKTKVKLNKDITVKGLIKISRLID